MRDAGRDVEAPAGQSIVRERWAKRLFLFGMAFMILMLASPSVIFVAREYQTDEYWQEVADRVGAIASPLIDRVVADREHGLIITLASDADDDDAREVWCSVLAPSGIDMTEATIEKAEPAGHWPTPQACEDDFWDVPGFVGKGDLW